MKPISRFLYISFVLIPPTFSFFRVKNSDDIEKIEKTSKNLRLTFQKLGPVFIKLGQMLSSRPDLIGPELASELRNLLDNQTPLPFVTVKNRLESELKNPLKNIFKKFNEKPVATASVAQVHKAVLFDGTTVAVKIQPKGLDKVFSEDLAVLKNLTKFFDLLLGSKRLQFSYVFKEFSQWVTRELDFRIEGRNIDRFRKNMETVEGTIIPNVYWDYTTKYILTTSFIEGNTVNNLLSKMKKQKVDSIYKLGVADPLEPDLVMQRIIRAFVKQVFLDGYFHGDLHPANIIITKDNNVGFIDFGITGIINNEEHTKLLYILLGAIDNNPKIITDVLKSVIAEPLSMRDEGKIYQDVATELDKVHHDTGGQVTIGNFILKTLSISSRYPTIWTPGLLLAAKTIAQIDAVARQIGITESVITIIKPGFEENMIGFLTKKFSKEKFFKIILDIMESAENAPRALASLETITHMLQTKFEKK